MQDARYKMQVGAVRPSRETGIQDARCKMQDVRCRMQDARCKMQDAGCKMQDSGGKLSEAKSREMGIQDASDSRFICILNPES
jgi:hypothetical protein